MPTRRRGRAAIAIAALALLVVGGVVIWSALARGGPPPRETPSARGAPAATREHVRRPAGHVREGAEGDAPGAPVEASAEIRLSVLGGGTGDVPLSGATICVIAGDDSPASGRAAWRGVPAGAPGRDAASTDASGSAALPGDLAGTRVQVRARGHLSRVVRLEGGDSVQPVVLRRARTIFVRITGTDREGGEGARCEVWVRDPSGARRRTDVVRPDADGLLELSIPDDAAQMSYFEVSAPGFLSAWVSPPVDDTASTRESPLIVRLEQAPLLHVACIDADTGRAVAGAEIREDGARVAVTDALGNAAFPVRGSDGARDYFVVAPGYGETLFYAHVNAAGELVGSELGSMVVRMQPCWSLSGRVVVSGGGEVPPGTVVVFRQRMAGDSALGQILGPQDALQSASVDGEGEFRLDDLGRSTAATGNVLYAMCPDGRVGRYPVVHKGHQQVDVVLPEESAARATEFVVRRADGRAMTDATLRVRWLPGVGGDLPTAVSVAPPLAVGAMREMDLRGTEAHVHVPLWPDAFYEVVVTDVDCLPERVTLRAGERERVDVTLAAARRIVGRVVDADGAGVGGVFVSVAAAGPSRVEPLDLDASWPGGEFQLTVPERCARSALRIHARYRPDGRTTTHAAGLRLDGLPSGPLRIVLEER